MSYCADKQAEALEIIQSEFKLSGPFTTERISGGLSGSEVIKVKTLNGAYIVRFWDMQWADYFPQDLACQLIASAAGYGPKVHFIDEAKGITMMDYHHAEPYPKIEAKLQALVDLLKKIHTGPEVPNGIDRRGYLNLLIDETKETPLLEAIRTIKDTVFAVTRPHASKVACHRDLHHGNLIYADGAFFAIDYTWGAMDDPFTDLANIAVFHCETVEEERLLLRLYLEREPNALEMARLSLLKLPIKIFYGLEFLGVASASGVDREASSSKSYRDFGHHDRLAPSPADLMHHGMTLLKEVIDYSSSEHYSQNLNLLLDDS